MATLLDKHFMEFNHYNEKFVKTSYDLLNREFNMAKRLYTSGTVDQDLTLLISRTLDSSTVLRGLLAFFRGTPRYGLVHAYRPYVHQIEVDLDLFDFDSTKSDDPIRFNTKQWIHRYGELLLGVRMFSYSFPIEEVDSLFWQFLPIGKNPIYHEEYVHRTIEEFMDLYNIHDVYMTRHTFALAKERVVDIWKAKSIELGTPIHIDDVPPVDRACLLSSSILRRSFEFVITS
jgi:hypothetical protein